MILRLNISQCAPSYFGFSHTRLRVCCSFHFGTSRRHDIQAREPNLKHSHTANVSTMKKLFSDENREVRLHTSVGACVRRRKNVILTRWSQKYCVRMAFLSSGQRRHEKHLCSGRRLRSRLRLRLRQRPRPYPRWFMPNLPITS